MKIGIVGAGLVGSAAAYACVMQGVGREIVLIDRNSALARAQAEDILHATPFSAPVQIRSGEYEDLEGASVVVVCAGVNQEPGETRLELLDRNAQVFGEVIPNILQHAHNPILLIATNPCDIMTQVATVIASSMGDLGVKQVIGTGTILDSARYRALLGNHLNISPKSVHAYVLGEHGDSEVLHWSGANAGNMPIHDFAEQIGRPLTDEVKFDIDQGVRGAAGSIISGKGATWYGIGAGVARICEAIEKDQQSVITCSIVMDEVEGVKDVALSLPHVIGAQGVVSTLRPKLSKDEKLALKKIQPKSYANMSTIYLVQLFKNKASDLEASEH